MRRKLTLVMVMILLCMQLTGCRAVEQAKAAVNNIKTKFQASSISETIASDNHFMMSSSTKKSQEKLQKSADSASKIAGANDKLQGFKIPVLSSIPVIGGAANNIIMAGPRAISSALTKKSAANLSKAEADYDEKKANDSVFQTSKEKAANDPNSTMDKLKRLLPAIIAVIAILLLLVFFVLKKKKPKQKPETTVKEPVKEPKAPPADAQAKLVARNEEKSIAQCKKYCAKYDIEYEAALAQYGGGDPKKLLEVLIGSTKEDFHPKK